MRRSIRKTACTTGSAIAELVCALILIVTIGLVFVDLSTLIIADCTGDYLLKDVLRTASSAQTPTAAQQSATKVMNQFSPNGLVQKPNLVLQYNVVPGVVSATLTLQIKLPVSMQGIDNVPMKFEAVEPITGLI